MLVQKNKFLLFIISVMFLGSSLCAGSYGDSHFFSMMGRDRSSTEKAVAAIRDAVETKASISRMTMDEEHKKRLHEQIDQTIEKLLNKFSTKKGWQDALLLGTVGSETYKFIEDIDAKGADVLLIAGAAKGGGVLGKAIDDVFDKRLGNLIGRGLDAFGNGISSMTHFCYKKVTGRSGDPFLYSDISVSKRVVGDMLSMLIEAGRKAANLGSRDKILRLDDEDTIDSLWLAMRTLMVNKFKTQVDLLEHGLEYYKKDAGSRIKLYAQQISDSLKVLVEHVLMPTKSYKDLGEGGYQNALQTLRKSIDSDYESLLKNLPQPSHDTSSLGSDSGLKHQDGCDRGSGIGGFSNLGPM